MRYVWLPFVLVLVGCSATAPPSPIPVRTSVAAGEVAVPPKATDAERSVVRVWGLAPTCDKEISGTGFVYAPQRVLTAAHVVAGVIPVSPIVTTADGEVYEGRVVAFDADSDVAVLYVPDLPAPALRITPAATLPSREFSDTRLLYYPKAKPIVTQPVPVEGAIRAEGPDLYERRQVTRMLLVLDADIHLGTSGAPLIVQGGTVAGMVTQSDSDGKRGYALAAEEILPIAEKSVKATKHVSTRKCSK